jgi:hypothetical protein
MDLLRDLVVLIPGISGSVLERDGRIVWGWSGGTLWRTVMDGGKAIKALALTGDDPSLDDLSDGVTATKLVPDAHLVPGFCKIDGYSAIRDLILKNFVIREGNFNKVLAANYFEFPYDWRRDNIVAARSLQRLVETALPQWKAHSGASDAKVIILAHSMGGLIARYWLESLDGWPLCRALITFGTPFRGAPKAAGYLANGYKMLFDLSDTMRSFASVYQLLPIYPAVQINEDQWIRVAECVHPKINRLRASEALRFHRKMETAVNRHQDNILYVKPETSYRLLPVVGVGQPTSQSAFSSANELHLQDRLPVGIESAFAGGDGTVPRVSATPIELSNKFMETFVSEAHSTLQRNTIILSNLRQQLIQMQARNHGSIRGPELLPPPYGKSALSIDVDDIYAPQEQVEIRIRLHDIQSVQRLSTSLATVSPWVSISQVGNPRQHARYSASIAEDGWLVKVADLRPGLYRVEVGLSETLRSHDHPTAVRDIFEIGGVSNSSI